MPRQPDDRDTLWDAPEQKWSGKVRVAALIAASLAAWTIIAGGVFLLTRWVAG